MERRDVLKAVAAAGVASAAFARALEALAAESATVTAEQIGRAEWIAGIQTTEAQRKLMLEDLGKTVAGYASVRAKSIENAVPPAFFVDSPKGAGLPPRAPEVAAKPARSRRVPPPGDERSVAYAPVTILSEWLRTKAISSTELTRLYLRRIEAIDKDLHAVITPTEKTALAQAARADAEIARGALRGPLHGVPYGAKDLLAAKGYPTTWGSPLFKDQTFEHNAAVVDRLEAAGAVLLAKTAVGELAWGDVWFGGMCRNPWKLDQGSSGSSAGSASLVAAGAAGFAIGTETWGSIVSPSTRCGTTGLRPTFGRVSRHGAMALSWTMDKIGPISRSVDDCAAIFAAIHGADPRDPASRSAPFAWPLRRDPSTIRLGYVKSLFEADYTKWADPGEDVGGYKEWKELDAAVPDALRKLGYRPEPISLEFSVPVAPLQTILGAEAATAFDELVRDGRVDKMVRQTTDAWPNTFRQGELIPAVEYIRANRLRSILMREMAKLFESIDVYVLPSFGGDNLLLTNLTGHPAVVVPNGFRKDGTPTSITFQGPIDGDDLVLAVARAYQDATGFHTKHPAI